MSDKNTILTSFRYFPGYLWPDLFAAKYFDIKIACIGDVCTKNICTENADAIEHLKIYLQFLKS